MEDNNRNEEIGKRIKKLRQKYNETQTKLGNLIGLSQNNISKIEAGEVALTLENLMAITSRYKVSLDYLCHGIDSDTILETLNKYFSIKYKKVTYGERSFTYPQLEINKALFDYMHKSAYIHTIKSMPKEIQEDWLKAESEKFYNNKSLTEKQTLIPLPPNLLFPDDNKADWKHEDLIRELNHQLLND